MKKLIVILSFIFTAGSMSAAFTNAKVKVTGVTCSMCSNSVHKALGGLQFIDKIDVDLENAVFILTFKNNIPVSADAIRQKIEGAGFSVGQLTMDFKFDHQKVSNDFHYKFDGNTYHFINVGNRELNSVVSLKFVDKGLTTNKEHKKYASKTTFDCIHTGRMEQCCTGGSAGRVYHVTI